MAKRKPAQIWWWLGLGLCVITLVAAVRPTSGAPPVFPGFDKVMHAAVFAILGAWFAALQSSARRWCVVALGLIVFGVAIEILQSITGRDPSIWDILADLTGIAVGILLLRAVTAHILGYIEDRVRATFD